MRKKTLLVWFLLCLTVESYQQSIRLSIVGDSSIDDNRLSSAFHQLLQSDFTVAEDRYQCQIPALESTISWKRDKNGFILLFDCQNESDVGGICYSICYNNRIHVHNLIDTTPIRSLVARHLNQLPPSSGDVPKERNPLVESLLDLNKLSELREKGFVVVDGAVQTTTESHALLSKFLVQDTGQGKAVRTDKVHFLNFKESVQCVLQDQFRLLMSCGTLLNENEKLLDFPNSPYEPLPPATKDRPLTVPLDIQLAEYGLDDFYKAHSDNSLTKESARDGQQIRANFRAYTCILYCTDDWTPDCGGALRMYPNTQHLFNVNDALSMDYVDIVPKNGRLLVFDSKLVHSVEKVTHPNKLRRALTLWINRPNDSGVKGEVIY
jgi:hypothetical protein